MARQGQGGDAMIESDGRRSRAFLWAVRWMLGLVILSYCAAPMPASAYICSMTATNVVFGSVNVLAGAAVDVTATLNLSCSAAPKNKNVRNCVSIDGGSAHDATSREMVGPGSLRFQLYSGAART